MFSVFKLFSVFFVTFGLNAQVISPNSTEVLFSYTAEFKTSDVIDPWAEAHQHHQYLFGVMHSPELTLESGITAPIEGIGSPRSDVDITVQHVEYDDYRATITYKINGRMLLHNTVANSAIKSGTLSIPLPNAFDNIYVKKCTDSYYTGFDDYWYFWNPYREGCEKLQNQPLSTKVSISIKPTRERKIEQTPRLDLLRGANGNGDLFSMFIVHGFSDASSDPKDDARENVDQLREYLLNNEFTERVIRAGLQRPLSIYNKQLVLPNGKIIDVEIKSLLVNTDSESRSVTFPRFFKEAVETADVIFYSGHSGLGGNLDLDLLIDRAGQGPFNFPKNKRQLFFFDSCSSYSYYLVPFSEQKTKARIDVITNALASYFHTGGVVLSAFLDVLLNEEIEDIRWIDALNYIESGLDGESYLMSVGGI